MGAYKRYTEKELAIAVKAVKETTDREKLGWATRLANRLQAEGVFPDRTYNSIYGIVAKAADIVKLDEIKEKIPQNRMGVYQRTANIICDCPCIRAAFKRKAQCRTRVNAS